jgi:hypothetical protein
VQGLVRPGFGPVRDVIAASLANGRRDMRRPDCLILVKFNMTRLLVRQRHAAAGVVHSPKGPKFLRRRSTPS